MPTKITLTQKEKKSIAITVMQQLQEMLEGNFEGNETLSLKIPTMGAVTCTKRPKIIITTTAGLKMSELVRSCTKEVGWHGFVERTDDTTFIIRDIVVYPQTVTGTNVNTDEEKYALWLANISTADLKTMRFQGHSHVNMACNPSSTDLELYNKYLSALKENDYYIFFICNKRGEINPFLYDLKTNTKYTKADIDIVKETDMSEWFKTVEPLIEEKKSITVTHAKQTNISDSVYPRSVIYDDSYYEMRERMYNSNSFDDSWDNRVAREKAKQQKNTKQNKK